MRGVSQFISERCATFCEYDILTSSYAQSIGYMSFNSTPGKSSGRLAVTSLTLFTTDFNPLTISYKSDEKLFHTEKVNTVTTEKLTGKLPKLSSNRGPSTRVIVPAGPQMDLVDKARP